MIPSTSYTTITHASLYQVLFSNPRQSIWPVPIYPTCICADRLYFHRFRNLKSYYYVFNPLVLLKFCWYYTMVATKLGWILLASFPTACDLYKYLYLMLLCYQFVFDSQSGPLLFKQPMHQHLFEYEWAVKRFAVANNILRNLCEL